MASPLQLLVIDDEPAIRQILAAKLARLGHAVDVAGGGREALERLARGDVAIALCDITMPDMTGIEVVRADRAAGRDTTFVMVTAYSSVETAVAAMAAGADDYLVKPVRSEELALRVARVAELRTLRRENAALRQQLAGGAAG